jgi:hypothetical protein
MIALEALNKLFAMLLVTPVACSLFVGFLMLMH